MEQLKNQNRHHQVEAFAERLKAFAPAVADAVGKSLVIREDAYVLVGKSASSGGTPEVYFIKSGDAEKAGFREISHAGLQTSPFMITSITILAGVQGTPTTSVDEATILTELQDVALTSVEAVAALKPLRNARLQVTVGGQSIFASQNFKVENCCAVSVTSKSATYHFAQPLYIAAKQQVLMSIKGDANIPQGTIVKVLLNGMTTAPKNTGNA